MSRALIAAASAAVLVTSCAGAGGPSSAPRTSAPAPPAADSSSGPPWPVVFRGTFTESGYSRTFPLHQGQAWATGGCVGDLQSVRVWVSNSTQRIADGEITDNGPEGMYLTVPREAEYSVGTDVLGDVRCHFEVRQR